MRQPAKGTWSVAIMDKDGYAVATTNGIPSKEEAEKHAADNVSQVLEVGDWVRIYQI
jgi:hypothetical protein